MIEPHFVYVLFLLLIIGVVLAIPRPRPHEKDVDGSRKRDSPVNLTVPALLFVAGVVVLAVLGN